jgi:hypothetical protein
MLLTPIKPTSSMSYMTPTYTLFKPIPYTLYALYALYTLYPIPNSTYWVSYTFNIGGALLRTRVGQRGAGEEEGHVAHALLGSFQIRCDCVIGSFLDFFNPFPTSAIRHTPYATRHTPFTNCHIPHTTHHTPHTTHHTPHTTHHTPHTTHHTPHTTHHTPHTTHHTPHTKQAYLTTTTAEHG